MLTNIFTHNLEKTKNLFVELLQFKVEYESDWFISMESPTGGKLSVLLQSSEFIPENYQKAPQGVMVTEIVDDVEATFALAKSMSLNIVEEPRDLPYGQRRFLIEDSSGLLLDISAPVAEPDPSYL